MSDQWQVFADRDGQQVQARPSHWELCLGCGAPCWHLFDGLSFHPEHWVNTTAGEREQMWRRLERWMGENPREYQTRLNRAAPPNELGQQQTASVWTDWPTSSVLEDTAATENQSSAPSGRRPAATPSRTTAAATAPARERAVTPARERRTGSSARRSAEPSPGRSRAGAAGGEMSFRAVAAVVDVTTIWLPDGTNLPLERPVRHLGDLEELGRTLQLGSPAVKWRTRPEAGQIVPTAALWRQLDVDVSAIPTRDDKRRAWLTELSPNLAALHDAAAEGWVFGDGRSAPQLRGITRLRRVEADRGEIVVLCLQAMDSTLPTDVPAGAGTTVTSGAGAAGTSVSEADPSVTARRLQLFAEAVGLPFRGAISTGMDLLELVTPMERKKQWEAVDYSDVGPANNGMLDGVFNWTRQPAAAEQQLEYVHAYDRNGAYLAACSSVLIGLGRPQLYEQGCDFDERRAGWWLVQVPQHEDWRWPSVLDPGGRTVGSEQWVTTTTLAYAVKEQGYIPQVRRAWLWTAEQSSRLLEPWYRVLRDARNVLLNSDDPQAPVVLEMVKQIYKRTNGWFAASAARGTAAFQPYMHHAIRAASKVGMLHTVKAIGNQSGAWPLVVADTDVLAYASDHRDPVAGWPGYDEGKVKLGSKLGTGLGGYKPYRSGTMEQQIPWLTGRGWGGRDTLQDVRDWSAAAASGATADDSTGGGGNVDYLRPFDADQGEDPREDLGEDQAENSAQGHGEPDSGAHEATQGQMTLTGEW